MVHAGKEGIHVMGIAKVAKGKLEENILRVTQSNQEFTKVEGLTFEVQTCLDYTEAYQALNMQPPAEI